MTSVRTLLLESVDAQEAPPIKHEYCVVFKKPRAAHKADSEHRRFLSDARR